MIELIVLDVDGCMSDGKVTYSYDGNKMIETKSFNARDGFAIVNWHKLGKKSVIITGRNSKIVQHRADELGITYCIQGCNDKLLALNDILKKEKLHLNEVAMIGDDLNDYKTLKEVSMSFAPNNANTLVKNMVDIPLNTAGGDGAVSEMIYFILKRDDLIDTYLKFWM